MCWGFNGGGQLGAGTTQNSTRPLTVVTNAVKPTPTFTPCPQGGCPTATPTPSGPPLTGIDWSIGVDANGDGHADCSTQGTDADTCAAALGSQFVLLVNLDALSPQLPAYVGFDAGFSYQGVHATGSFFTTWPDCNNPPSYFGINQLGIGCNIFAGIYTSDYVGQMLGVYFTCTASGSVTMLHGAGNTGLVDQASFSYHYEGNPSSETLTINCIDPNADADGDGCTNGQELSANQYLGGKRDPYNPWDFFDPTEDGRVRVDDVLAVVQQYLIDSPQAGYTMKTDRTFLGPNSWSLGPPNGQQRVDDILNSVQQYYNDCS
jgi:hypothetical protein